MAYPNSRQEQPLVCPREKPWHFQEESSRPNIPFSPSSAPHAFCASCLSLLFSVPFRAVLFPFQPTTMVEQQGRAFMARCSTDGLNTCSASQYLLPCRRASSLLLHFSQVMNPVTLGYTIGDNVYDADMYEVKSCIQSATKNHWAVQV